MQRAILLIIWFWASSVGAAEPATDKILDLRRCPLDTITFIDPWTGTTFEVKRVGANYHYNCPNGFQQSRVSDECKGPFGDLIFQGEFGEDGSKKTMFAIYTTIQGSPCCGWSSSEGKEDTVISGRKNFKWLSRKDVPRLGDVPFASIESEPPAPDSEAEWVLGNPLIAMKCRLP